MDEIPIMSFIGPAIALIAIPAMFIFRKKMMASAEKTYANFRLADVAQRMGLQVVEGDPNLNLMMAYSTHMQQDYQKTGKGLMGAISGDGTKETRARLAGSPHGRPVEFAYHFRSDIEPGLAVVRHKIWFECRLSLPVAAGFPDFEIVKRNASAYAAADPEFPLPPQSFGQPALDAALSLTSGDARVGPAIANACGALTTFQYVHVQGAKGFLHSLASQNGSSTALYHIEQMLLTLEQLASTLEGKQPGAPVPAQRAY